VAAFMNCARNILLIIATSVSSIATGTGVSGQASTAMEQFQKLQEQLRQAHADGDAVAYLSGSRRMHDFVNGSPSSVLQLMSAEAFAGDTDDALLSLEQFVRMGQSNEEILKAKQFDAMRKAPQYRKTHDAMASNSSAVSVARKVFSLPEAALIPEDIDFDSAARIFYVTSVFSKEIFAIDTDGHAQIFAKSPDSWPMMAVKVDVRRQVLWATEVAIDGFTLSPREDWGRSAAVIYDLKSGKVLHRVEGPFHTALGDMTLTVDGDAIVSDGDHGGVYRISRTSWQIERLDGGDFISPQTAAMLPDGLHLLVPDYVRGIGVLDLKTKEVFWIPMEGKYALSGIDGLYLFGRTLIATQNGTSPERVVRFDLDTSLRHVESESILERATATLGDPTHGVVVDGSFYYIANSGWDTLDEHGNRKAGAAASQASLMRTDLDAKQNRPKPLDQK
jgi:hypothetical protein